MTDSYLRGAFEEVLKEAEKPERCYVSLYRREPYFGGPEEGGWWGEYCILEQSQMFLTKEKAENARDKVMELAKKLSDEGQRRWGDRCLKEMEQCDARGEDYDTLPETDGPTTYSVMVEETQGEFEQLERSHYE